MVIIETVGVGQTELDIVDIADSTLVVLVPEAGDTIQTMKAGLMEIADIFIVNKADRDGADKMLIELKSMVEMNEVNSNGWKVPVMLSQASHDIGVDELYATIHEHKAYSRSQPGKSKKKRKIRRQELIEILSHRFSRTLDMLGQEDETFRAYLKEAEKEKANPYKIAKQIFQDEKVSKKIFNVE